MIAGSGCRALCLILSLMVAGAQAQQVAAGECRSQMRILLAQVTPDKDSIAAVANVCQQQADAGDPDASYQLALLYLGMTEWAPDKAIPKISEAAESGVAEAQYWLAWQYDAGPLLANDAQQALYWYRQAGASEHPLALYRLAEIYTDGELGVVPDLQKAIIFRAQAKRCEDNQRGRED